MLVWLGIMTLYITLCTLKQTKCVDDRSNAEQYKKEISI